MDARTAYETLTTLELRLRGDRFEDIAEGIHAVTWPFLTNEHAIARLLGTGRITRAESELLERIRRREKQPPETDDDGVEVYPDLYELLLVYYPTYGADPVTYRYRGHGRREYRLVPTLMREATADALEPRLRRLFAYVERLAAHAPQYEACAESDDPQRFLELLAVAQHYGLPTHLLDFTADLRVAAFFACLGARPGDIGEVLMLHVPQFERFGNREGSPYGALVVRSAPNRRIERQRGLFLAGHDALVHHDPRTGLLQRARFRQDGRELSAIGGYDRAFLLDEGPDDPLVALGQAAGPAPVAPSRALARHFERYTEHARALWSAQFERMGESEYARTCAWAVKAALADDAPWIDRRVGTLFTLIQIDVAGVTSREHLRAATRARHAFDAYLRSSGSLEERLARAVELTWIMSVPERDPERAQLVAIIDRRMDEFAADVNGPDADTGAE